MSSPIRLQKYIASCGYCSRRHAELLIQAGLVKVNEERVERLGTRVTPGQDQVVINGDPVVPPPVHHLALHKPCGFITAEHDTHDRLTVMDLLPRRYLHAGVSPAGRLDLNTSGLLIFTNDGDLAHRICHPRYGCRKRYQAVVLGPVSDEALDRLRKGVPLEDGLTLPAQVTILEQGAKSSRLELVLVEGRKRQIRLMCKAVGHEVLSLSRQSVGGVELGDLQSGEVRELSPEEVTSFQSA